jgi:hypothetical protein
MKVWRLAGYLLSISVLAGMSTAPVQASVIDNAVSAVKTDNVYVDSSTQAANPNVLSTLKGRLTPDDNIVVVMVEADSADITKLAEALNGATGNSKTIAIAVGGDVYARSTQLPGDQSNDLMQRSKSVSVTTVETLTRFIREVHDWQAKQPKPVATPTSDGVPVWLIIGAVIGFAVSLFLVRDLRKRRIRNESQFTARYAPEPVVRQLEVLQRKTQFTGASSLKHDIDQLCADSDKCFKGLKPDELEYGITQDSLVRNLGHVATLLDKYVEIKDDARYIKDASSQEKKVIDAIREFGESVFEAASKNSHKRISSMDIDIDILKFHNL